MPQPTVSGWLEKKSGGKEGQRKRLTDRWEKRWFALVGSQLSYYKSEADYTKAKAPLGFVEVQGAKIFLKEVKGTAFRFTVKTAARELKLRAPTPSAYKLWADALTPLAQSVGELSADMSTREGDDEEEEEEGGYGASSSVVAPPLLSGWLEKKSGGKESFKNAPSKAKKLLLDKWDRRWFTLGPGTQMSYWKTEKDLLAGKPALGVIECFGASVFLKEVKGTVFRFTVRSETRALKLRAPTAADYQKWTSALGPLTNQVRAACARARRHAAALRHAACVPACLRACVHVCVCILSCTRRTCARAPSSRSSTIRRAWALASTTTTTTTTTSRSRAIGPRRCRGWAKAPSSRALRASARRPSSLSRLRCAAAAHDGCPLEHGHPLSPVHLMRAVAPPSLT